MTPFNLNSLNIAFSLVITYLVYLCGTLGAVLMFFPIISFVLTPNLAAAWDAAQSVIAMGGLLVVGTAGWNLNQHYTDLAHGMKPKEVPTKFSTQYIGFVSVFAWFTGVCGFLFCFIGFLLVGPTPSVLTLTGMAVVAAVVGYQRVEKT
jgi:uncharacterized membrane protein YbhN (UPF0104 family)